MKKREILIVIAVIAFGLIYNAIRSGDIDITIDGIAAKPSQLKDRNHPHDITVEAMQYAQVNQIEIRNIAGDIEIKKTGTQTDTQTRIEPVIRVYHKDNAQAEGIGKKIKISPQIIENDTPSGKKTTLRLVVGSDGNYPLRRVRVHLKIFIPTNVELKVRNRYGDIEIENCGKQISLDGKYGDISVKRVDADVKITHRNGRIALSEVSGELDLDSRHSRIKINDVSALKLNCYLSKVYISEVKETARIEYAAHSTVTIDRAKGLTVDGRHTKLKLTGLNGSIRVKNSHESIYMQDINGSIHIDANNCKIGLDRVVSEGIVIKNAYNHVTMDEITAGSLDILMKNGNLELAFTKIKERLNIKNTHSKITLVTPEGEHPFFNLQARYGRITNRTPEELTLFKERDHQSATSSALESKPEITVNTTYGDILLKSSQSQPGQSI